MENMSPEKANQVYDLLISKVGADEADRTAFAHEFKKTFHTKEWRYQSSMGFGGKFRTNENGVYIDCYQENESPEINLLIRQINRTLAAMNIKLNIDGIKASSK
jgi:hypothetical protein